MKLVKKFLHSGTITLDNTRVALPVYIPTLEDLQLALLPHYVTRVLPVITASKPKELLEGERRIGIRSATNKKEEFKRNKLLMADALTFGMTPHRNDVAALVGASDMANQVMYTLLGEGAFMGAAKGFSYLTNLNKPLQTIPEITRMVQDNGKIRLSLPSHTTARPRQIILEPQGNNKFYVHIRTWDGDHIPANITNEEKQALYNALYEELPAGAEILFPKSGPGNYGSRGTVVGLQRLSRDPRFTPETKGTLQYLDKDGKTVRTYEGTSFIKTPRITAENAVGITPQQWTAAQDAAIARGDMAEALRLRDLHFKMQSGNNNEVFGHSTHAKFTKFDKSYFGERDEGFNGKGFYFATTRIPENPSLHRIKKGPHGEIPTMNYGPNKMYVYLKGDREFTELTNPSHTRDFFKEPNTVGITDKYLYEKNLPTEIIVGNPNNIKLADAVSYGNDGVRIPLGERDNFNIDDIRYAIPTTIGTSALGASLLYNYLDNPSNLQNYLETYKNGGKPRIHIKPENRGKFTALKKRTGKSATWFKEHGTPALKKMAIFALNSRKWRH